jgi:hypothetical protein
MTDIAAVTVGGRETDLPSSAVDDFASRLWGELILPGHRRYEPARQIWNGMIDRRPALVARCAGAEDVVAAVNFARDNELLLAARGGGHGVAGHALCEGGLVIDLSQMRPSRSTPRGRPRVRRGAARWATSTARPSGMGSPPPWEW